MGQTEVCSAMMPPDAVAMKSEMAAAAASVAWAALTASMAEFSTFIYLGEMVSAMRAGEHFKGKNERTIDTYSALSAEALARLD